MLIFYLDVSHFFVSSWRATHHLLRVEQHQGISHDSQMADYVHVLVAKLLHYEFDFVLALDFNVVLLVVVGGPDGEYSEHGAFGLAPLVIETNLITWRLFHPLNHIAFSVLPVEWVLHVQPGQRVSFHDLNDCAVEQGHRFRLEFQIVAGEKLFEDCHLSQLAFFGPH